MTLSAPELSSFQRCPRILKISAEKVHPRWRPRELFEAHLRRGILELAKGADLQKITTDLQASFLEFCARPGLAVEANPFVLARDFTAMLGNVLEAISRHPLVSVESGPKIILSADLEWQCKAFADADGVLHRWTSCERLDADTLAREFHSWNVWGDMCAAQVPMKLHVVEIGRRSGNHQSTPWCRIYKHPEVIGRFAFQRKDGSPLEGAWKPAWFQDSDKNQHQTWVDLMERDGVRLIRHLDVKGPNADQVREFVRQVSIEAGRIRSVEGKPWQELPMYRPACDLPICQWQDHCFNGGGEGLDRK